MRLLRLGLPVSSNQLGCELSPAEQAAVSEHLLEIGFVVKTQWSPDRS